MLSEQIRRRAGDLLTEIFGAGMIAGGIWIWNKFSEWPLDLIIAGVIGLALLLIIAYIQVYDRFLLRYFQSKQVPEPALSHVAASINADIAMINKKLAFLESILMPPFSLSQDLKIDNPPLNSFEILARDVRQLQSNAEQSTIDIMKGILNSDKALVSEISGLGARLDNLDQRIIAIRREMRELKPSTPGIQGAQPEAVP